MYTHPRPNTIIQKGDKLFLCGRKSQYKKFLNDFALQGQEDVKKSKEKETNNISFTVYPKVVVSGQDLLTRRSFETFLKQKNK